MAKDCYSYNISFLKSKGINLTPAGDTFYKFEDDTFNILVNEWQDMRIHNKKSGKSQSVNLVVQLLEDEDLS